MTPFLFPHLRNSTLLSACLALGLAGTAPAWASETSSTSSTSSTTEAEAQNEDMGETDTAMEGEVDEETLDQGRTVFLDEAKPACKTCHVLEDAEARGRVGPNLDEMSPSVEMVRNALMSGPGAMPEYGERLDEEQIEALSQYVAHATGGADASATDDSDAEGEAATQEEGSPAQDEPAED